MGKTDSVIELNKGNYKGVSRGEVVYLVEQMYIRYTSLGGKYPISGFNSYKDSPAYEDLKQIMINELAKLLSSNRENLRILLDLPEGNVDGRTISQIIVPSEQLLKKIIYESKKATVKGQNYRKTNLDACYLFALGQCRPSEDDLNEPTLSKYQFEEKCIIEFPIEAALERDKELEKVFSNSGDPHCLQFIGLYSNDSILCHGNLLSHKIVQKWLLGTHPTAKLQQLITIGPSIHNNLRKLNEDVDGLNQGEITWALLDVRQGGLFYHNLHGDSYVIGACLVQKNLEKGSKIMLQFVKEIEDYLGLGTGESEVVKK